MVCTYNRGHLLRATIESLLAQCYRPAEIVVLDDGSTDDTADVLAGFGSAIRRHHQPNRGIAIARTEVCRLARGELIAFHDDDDLMPPERLTTLYDALCAHPGAVMAVGDWAVVDSEGKPTGARWLPEQSDGSRHQAVLIEDGYEAVLWPTVPAAPHTTLFRRADGDRLGWFDPQFRYASEDKDFFARLARLGPIVYVPEVVSHLRRGHTHDSLTRDAVRTDYWSLFLFAKHLPVARESNPRLYRRLQFRIRTALERIARHALGSGALPSYVPADYLDRWLPLLGVKDRLRYEWRARVRLPLAKALMRRGRG